MAVLLAVAACGDGDAPTATPAPTAAPATTAATSTTITTTTTLPLIPEIAVDPVAMPTAVLTDEFGGGIVETWCEIEYVEMADGTIVLDPVQTGIFRFLGIEHDRSDCDLALDDLLLAERYSAQYSGVGECFTGYRVQGDVVARTAAGEWRWPIDIDHEPPTIIHGCDGDEEPPGGPVPFGVRVRPFHDPLVEMFGPLGGVAWAFGGTHFLDVGDEPPDPVVYEALAAGLQAESPFTRCDTAEAVEGLAYRMLDFEDLPDWDAGLQTLVPYLIDTVVDLGTSGEGDDLCDLQLNNTLTFLTGRDLWGAREWAEWWVGREGR